jgi:hypothetical protein
MKSLWVVLAVLALCSAGLSQKKTDVQVLESKARRSEDKVRIDARIKVTSEKPLKGLVLVFNFLDADGHALTTEKAGVEDDSLAPGDETGVHAEAFNPPGAIKYKIQAFAGGERELRIGNSGPFIIE